MSKPTQTKKASAAADKTAQELPPYEPFWDDPNYGEQQAQHSPLPWNVFESESELMVTDIRGDSAAICGNADSKTVQADAKLIVRAVNHAEALAEQLKKAQAYLVACNNQDYTGARKAIAEGIQAALAAYEEEAR